jgi:magnesium-transporting ATPase (P-type)
MTSASMGSVARQDAGRPSVKQPPRSRNERVTDDGFLGSMFLTGLLTAGVSLAVYLYALKHESLEMARTHAFAALVFAELLRAFGARSETRPLWRMNLLSNLNLLLVASMVPLLVLEACKVIRTRGHPAPQD